MDVRCEKCQTEYELDESRLKPGGVTVKCTNCGHMFKIRKRTNTNVGVPVVAERTRPNSSKPPLPGEAPGRADSVLGGAEAGTEAPERQWLIRLPNGEQKSCRELATLQQWIVAGVATRDSLISRSGKTWKRLGDIAELSQYFTIADEAKAQRSHKPTNKPQPKPDDVRATMLGVGAKVASAGGTVIPDEDDGRTTGNFRARSPTPPPPPPKAAPAKPNPMAQTEVAPPATAPRRPPTQPPPIPGNRSTAAWATNDIKATDSMAAMPQGPQGGKLSAIPDEPAFAGRVRVSPTDDQAFTTGRSKPVDDDDDLIPGRERGSRAGLWIAVLAVIVIGAAAGVVYMTVFKKKAGEQAVKPPADAAQVATAKPDAAPIVTPIPAIDAAAAVPVASPLDDARASLGANAEQGMRTALEAVAGKDDPPALAVRARLTSAIAQALQDRAGLVDKAEGDKLRKQAKQLVIDAAVLAQKAQKAAPDDVTANLAMADVLRLQGKSARDVKRYIDLARSKAGKDLARELDLADGMISARDGKLDDAQKALMAADTDPADVRAKLALALIAFAQGKPADAKAFTDQVVATQPDHPGAKALQAKLETTVVKTDPLPPEDGGGSKGSAHTPVRPPPDINGGGGGTDYDSLLARGNKLAETNCTKAMDLFQKALEQKPNGIEALTAMGYCHIDAKQFASAFSKFRAALAVSPRYEPALGGVAEAYQQQGRKDQAIESWRAYLEVYPNSAKAKRQLEILGAGAEPSGSGSAPTPTPPTPTTPTPTPPAPAPAPAAGSGSG
ncbi:MAG: family finger-like protein [Myxococcales bacterium]|nr:family finger-like protein [Myxococcales bacterium]